MPDIQLGSHTLKSHGFKVATVHKYDWIILLLLGTIDIILNVIEPFHRFVGEEMMTDLKYPFHEDTIPMWAVPFYAIVLPAIIFCTFYIFRKDVYDFHHAILGLFYSILITLVITDAIKDAVGRPRPNFFWRCFPDGQAVFDPETFNVMCTGDKKIIKEGYKSFPSGHSSVSFAGLGFLAWYLSGKIRVFDRRGHAAKLCIVLLPLLAAALVATSRVDDYWHHWQDVFAGSLLGLVIASFCYLQSFPLPNQDGWAPHTYFVMMDEERNSASAARMTSLRQRQPDVESQDSHPTMRRFRRRRRYRRLETLVITNEENSAAEGRRSPKLWKIRVTRKLRLKVTSSSMAILRRLRNAYVGMMLCFAGRVAQLNNGNVHLS